MVKKWLRSSGEAKRSSTKARRSDGRVAEKLGGEAEE